MTVAVIAWRPGRCSGLLAAEWRGLGVPAQLLSPIEAKLRLGPGDVAVNRIDVRQTLDGIEPGQGRVAALQRRGVRVVNHPPALRAAHDKLATLRLLERAGLPQPRSEWVCAGAIAVSLEPPVVVKPRYGAWGRDVTLCRDGAQLERCLQAIAQLRWFHHHGALVQEYLPHSSDLRVIVAGGRAVGAAARTPAPGEWRTNFSLGGTVRPARPTAADVALAIRACAALHIDLAGVDLTPVGHGQRVVLEVNGAPDFDHHYSLPGGDVFADAAAALCLLGHAGSAPTSGASPAHRL